MLNIVLKIKTERFRITVNRSVCYSAPRNNGSFIIFGTISQIHIDQCLIRNTSIRSQTLKEINSTAVDIYGDLFFKLFVYGFLRGLRFLISCSSLIIFTSPPDKFFWDFMVRQKIMSFYKLESEIETGGSPIFNLTLLFSCIII